MNKKFDYVCVAAVVLTCQPQRANSEHLGACADCGAAAQKCELVDRVIMVSKMCVETVMKTRRIQIKDTHDETYTVFQMKPVKRQITKQHCYLVDEVRTKPIETTQCQIYDVPELTTYPPKECKTCEGKGKGEVEGSKGATDHGCRKVVANSTVKSEVSYCVKVPKYKTEVCAEIETYELVPVERTRTVLVCVPRIEVYPCEITVKKWFPQTIKCCSTCAVNHPKKRDSRAESSSPLYTLSRSFRRLAPPMPASQRSRAEPSVSLLRTRQLCHSHVIDRHISGV